MTIQEANVAATQKLFEAFGAQDALDRCALGWEATQIVLPQLQARVASMVAYPQDREAEAFQACLRAVDALEPLARDARALRKA